MTGFPFLWLFACSDAERHRAAGDITGALITLLQRKKFQSVSGKRKRHPFAASGSETRAARPAPHKLASRSVTWRTRRGGLRGQSLNTSITDKSSRKILANRPAGRLCSDDDGYRASLHRRKDVECPAKLWNFNTARIARCVPSLQPPFKLFFRTMPKPPFKRES